MPGRAPQETTRKVVQYTSWAAPVFAALLLWAGLNFDSLGPADGSGRLFATIGFTATMASTAWWAFRQATTPNSVRAAVLATDIFGLGLLILAMWTYPATGSRWLLLVGAAVSATAGIWLWRYRRLAGLRVATDEQGRVSVSDDVRRSEQEMRSQPW